MQQVPWWGVASSAAPPVLLVGSWTAAARLQPHHFDSVRQSVSTLARTGATDRWVMTLALVVAAVCYMVTGLGLRPAASAGRVILVTGGFAGLLVAASPVPALDRFSLAHAVWSAVGFTLLAAWPLGARRHGPAVPWALRPSVATVAVGVIALVLAWFIAELIAGGEQIGLAERVLGGPGTGTWRSFIDLALLGALLVHHGKRDPDRRRAVRGKQAAADVPAGSTHDAARGGHAELGPARVAGRNRPN